MRDYRKIEAWKMADEVTVKVYQNTVKFPNDERYGLTSQIRRASVSVPANIAEGSARESLKDYLHFLYIARGSLTETQYLAHLSTRLEYLTPAQAQELERHLTSAFKTLHGLIRSVEAESGKIGRTIAAVTSCLVLSLSRIGLVPTM